MNQVIVYPKASICRKCPKLVLFAGRGYCVLDGIHSEFSINKDDRFNYIGGIRELSRVVVPEGCPFILEQVMK